MAEPAPQPEPRYRLIGIRNDGSRATVLGSMTFDEAQRAREAVAVAGVFASVHIAPDSERPGIPPPATQS